MRAHTLLSEWFHNFRWSYIQSSMIIAFQPSVFFSVLANGFFLPLGVWRTGFFELDGGVCAAGAIIAAKLIKMIQNCFLLSVLLIFAWSARYIYDPKFVETKTKIVKINVSDSANGIFLPLGVSANRIFSNSTGNFPRSTGEKSLLQRKWNAFLTHGVSSPDSGPSTNVDLVFSIRHWQ